MIDVLILLAIAGLMQATRTFASSATSGATELTFGYLLLAAFFAARVGSRLGLPKLTGYLLAGVASGPFVLGLVSKDMAGSLTIVNGVAACILGLSAGAELDLRRVKPLLATLRSITVFGVIFAMLVLAIVLFALQPFLPMFAGTSTLETLAICGVVSVALSAQSPTVVIALLAETRAEGPLSRLVLATVVMADLVVIVVYSIVAAIAGAIVGGGVAISDRMLAIAWELFGSMGFGVIVGLLIARYIRSVERGATLFTVMVCVVVAEIGARLHLDPLVVMLAAGVWLRNASRADAHDLLDRLASAELPVFLVFFSLAGCKLDLQQLWAMLIPVAVIAAVRASVFYVGCRMACARTHAEPIVTRYGWTGLVPQAGLSLALVVVIQKNFPDFGQPAAMLLLSVVGINQLIAPILLRLSLVRSGEAGRRAPEALATTN